MIDVHLIDSRGRWNSPSLGRFTSTDIGFIDHTNLYVSLSNNPVVALDPTGHITVFFHGWGGAKRSAGSPAAGAASDASSIEIEGKIPEGQPTGTENPSSYQLYGWGGPHSPIHFESWQVDEALKRIEKETQNCPPIVIVGHSLGGLAAIQLTNKLKKDHLQVDLLVTLDPITRPIPQTITPRIATAVGTLERPDNAKVVWNYYQNGDRPFGHSMPKADRNILNYRNLGHRELDDDRDIARAVERASFMLHFNAGPFPRVELGKPVPLPTPPVQLGKPVP